MPCSSENIYRKSLGTGNPEKSTCLTSRGKGLMDEKGRDYQQRSSATTRQFSQARTAGSFNLTR